MKRTYIILLFMAFVWFSYSDKTEADEIGTSIEIGEKFNEEVDEFKDSVYISKEWLDIECDSCVLYFCEDFHKYTYIVDEKTNALNQNIEILGRHRVGFKDAFGLVEMFSRVHALDEITECLFQPRHGFIFYRNNIVVAHSSVCMTCRQHMSIPKSGIDFDVVLGVLNKFDFPSTRLELIEYYKENNIKGIENH
jgi:hypothetical protein